MNLKLYEGGVCEGGLGIKDLRLANIRVDVDY
jgi:hypothetical protein